MNKVIKATFTSMVFLVAIAYGGEAKEISIVKKGKVSYCPNTTVEEIVNSLMEKPKWELFNHKGNNYVNASGVTASGRPANVVMQFWVRNNGEWGMQAFDVDGQPQEWAGLVIIELCKKAEYKRGAAEQEAEEERLSKVKVTPAEPINDSRDGKKYKTVKIGEQIWMAENLNYEIKKGFLAKLTSSSNSKCYENKEDNCKKYGRLYDWTTAMKVCPSGWHLPNDKEWEVLTKIARNKATFNDDAGKYLKAKSGWANDGNGTDIFGFAALPGGSGSAGYTEDHPILAGKSIHHDEMFYDVGDIGHWWSATELGNDDASYLSINGGSDGVSIGYHDNKAKLYSVRCVKD